MLRCLPFKENFKWTRKKSRVVYSHNVFQSLPNPNATLPKLKKQVKDSLIQKRSRDWLNHIQSLSIQGKKKLTCKPGIKKKTLCTSDFQKQKKSFKRCARLEKKKICKRRGAIRMRSRTIRTINDTLIILIMYASYWLSWYIKWNFNI